MICNCITRIVKFLLNDFDEEKSDEENSNEEI